MGLINDLYEIYCKKKKCLGNYRYGEYNFLCKGAEEKCCRYAELCKIIYERNIEDGSDKCTNSNTITE